MSPKMSFVKALSILETHAIKHTVLFIDESLPEVADSIWRGILECLFDKALAKAITFVWEHYKRRANEIDYLSSGESVLGLERLVIDPDGDHEFYLLTEVKVDPELFGDPSAGEDSDE